MVDNIENFPDFNTLEIDDKYIKTLLTNDKETYNVMNLEVKIIFSFEGITNFSKLSDIYHESVYAKALIGKKILRSDGQIIPGNDPELITRLANIDQRDLSVYLPNEMRDNYSSTAISVEQRWFHALKIYENKESKINPFIIVSSDTRYNNYPPNFKLEALQKRTGENSIFYLEALKKYFHKTELVPAPMDRTLQIRRLEKEYIQKKYPLEIFKVTA